MVLIGAPRIIGGRKEDWIRGYCRGLKDALETNGHYEELEELYRKLLLSKKEYERLTEDAARESAVLDVLMTYRSYIYLLKCSELAWSIVKKSIERCLRLFGCKT